MNAFDQIAEETKYRQYRALKEGSIPSSAILPVQQVTTLPEQKERKILWRALPCLST